LFLGHMCPYKQFFVNFACLLIFDEVRPAPTTVENLNEAKSDDLWENCLTFNDNANQPGNTDRVKKQNGYSRSGRAICSLFTLFSLPY